MASLSVRHYQRVILGGLKRMVGSTHPLAPAGVQRNGPMAGTVSGSRRRVEYPGSSGRTVRTSLSPPVCRTRSLLAIASPAQTAGSGSHLGHPVYSSNPPLTPCGVPLMTYVTRILSAIAQGDLHTAEQLLPLVSHEL